MKTSQSFPFYPLDFTFGTMMMTPAQVGGYIRALCYQWETGGFPIDETQQKIVTGCDESDLKIILGKFVRKKTQYINLRMEQVRKERLHFIAIQRINGKKGGRPRKNPWVSNGLTQTEPKKTLPSPSPSPSPNNTPLPPRGKFAPVVPDGIETKVATALADWAKHRQDKKRPITPIQWDRLITEAKTQGQTFIRKVEYSIAQGYQGLFEPSQSANGNTSNPATESHGLRQANVFDRNAPKPA